MYAELKRREKARKRAIARQANKAHYKAKDFQYDLKKHYGLSLAQYNEMYLLQGGKCAICSQPEASFKRKLHVDHNHSTGQVRGLLCTQCNPGIGYFQESIERLEMALTYLKKFKK